MFSSTKEKTNQKQALASSKSKESRYAFAFKVIIWQVLAFLLVEFSLSLAGLGEEEIFKLDPVLGFKHMGNKKVTWRSEGFATSYFNQDGLREPELSLVKPAGTFRVALLGDSLTESLQVPFEQSFAYQIQQRLSKQCSRPVQVINFGTSGYSTAQEYLQLKLQVLNYKPDLVLLCYNSRDCFENWSPPDEVLTNVRPAALHLPGGKLIVDSSPVSGWMRTPRARFLQQVEFLRHYSRLWGLFSAAELDWSMHNDGYKRLLFFLTKPGKAIRQTAAELAGFWKDFSQKSLTADASPFKNWTMLRAFNKTNCENLQAFQSATVGIKHKSSEAVQSANPCAHASSASPGLAETHSLANSAAKTVTGTVVLAKTTPSKKASRSIYHDLVVRTLGSLLASMNATCNASGARFAVVAMPVRSALYAKQGMATAFNDFDYNDELEMLQGVCKEKELSLINVHEPAKALSAQSRDYLFYLVHLTPRGHDFVAEQLAPAVESYVAGATRSSSLDKQRPGSADFQPAQTNPGGQAR